MSTTPADPSRSRFLRLHASDFSPDGLLREVFFHPELSRPVAEGVDRIEIGSQIVRDRGQIAEIVHALNPWDRYSLPRGDAADRVPFVIWLTSGQPCNYEATRYQHGKGTALVSHSPSGWDKGAVFCRKLPAALAEAEVRLPPGYTTLVRPSIGLRAMARQERVGRELESRS